MADFSNARRAMETADLIDRLKALHDLEDARDIPDAETQAVLKEAAVQLGLLTERVETSERVQKAAMDHSKAYKTVALAQMDTPDFQRAAAQLQPLEAYSDRMWSLVKAFEQQMDERGFLKGEEGRVIQRLIWKYLRHDLAGELGSYIRYAARRAVTALRGLPTPDAEKEPTL